MEKQNGQKMLDLLNYFFLFDKEIKITIRSIAPNEEDGYNEDATIDYADRLYNALVEMETQFLTMAPTLYGEQMVSIIHEVFEIYIDTFLKCNYDFQLLKSFYRRCISEMRPVLVKNVKSGFGGYRHLDNSIYDYIKPGITINEMLHVFHNAVMNNEKFYQSISILDQKINDNDFSVVLRGTTDNVVAWTLYENWPLELDTDEVEILSLKGKTLLMIRAIGHATTIEITEEEQGCFVEYFIPKLCNIEMINALKGIDKVPETADMLSGARGRFVCSKEDLLNEIYNFVAMVPTDADYIRR